MKNKKQSNSKPLSKATIAQRERRRKEALLKQQIQNTKEAMKPLQDSIPVYEGKKLIGYTDTLKVSSNAEFRKDLGIALRKPKRAKKIPIITTKKSKTGCFPLIFIAYLLFWAVYGWMNTSEIVEAKIDNLSDVKVEEVKTTTPDVKVEPEVILEVVEPILDSIESYICSKDWDCKIALAVLKSENFNMNCQAINTGNSDGSVDKGLWQVNSIHGRTDTELFDCYANTDIAYGIYQSQGWNAWTGYWRGNYKKYLD